MAFAQPLRVACVGNSITFGSGLRDRQSECYPNQLQMRLGSGYRVENFGVSGATVLSTGDVPYCRQVAYRAALRYKPDLLIIKLGTNDSKAHNREKSSGQFIRDYKNIISSFRKANPGIRIMICLPVPVFGEAFGIRESVLKNEIRPAIEQIAREEKADLIDLFTPLQAHSEWFPDKVHPDASGAAKIAAVVFEAIKKLRIKD